MVDRALALLWAHLTAPHPPAPGQVGGQVLLPLEGSVAEQLWAWALESVKTTLSTNIPAYQLCDWGKLLRFWEPEFPYLQNGD